MAGDAGRNPESYASLVEINIDDMLNAWGLQHVRCGRGFLRALARPFAAAFARQILRFDQVVGDGGLRVGGAMLCERYTAGVRAAGLASVHRDGPLLLLSNHPGLTDTVALFAAIDRSDLRVIAFDRPFLRALPNTNRWLYALSEDVSARASVMRRVARHLRDGGSALTFPAGEIEPDPSVLPGARASLANWSDSIGVFARLVPDLAIVVAIVSGVLYPSALRHPITRLRRQRRDRELLAAALQLAWRPYQRNIVSIAFASPMQAADLLADDRDPPQVTRAIRRAAADLLACWPARWEVVVAGRRLSPDGQAN
jgi:hypothetical protein